MNKSTGNGTAMHAVRVMLLMAVILCLTFIGCFNAAFALQSGPSHLSQARLTMLQKYGELLKKAQLLFLL